eukprot:365669-Chlamydomonas_euryale.AAC.8
MGWPSGSNPPLCPSSSPHTPTMSTPFATWRAAGCQTRRAAMPTADDGAAAAAAAATHGLRDCGSGRDKVEVGGTAIKGL